MEGTRVERKGREKVVAWRRVERTAIVAVVARGSRIGRWRARQEWKGDKLQVEVPGSVYFMYISGIAPCYYLVDFF